MKGIVTDIQRFSLNDGDGIRTTVFLKGCDMRCSWCHNPETISYQKELMFYADNCIGCGKCFAVCPTGAQQLREGKHIVDRTLCIACGKCADVCFADALRFSGQVMTTDDVMAQIRQDKLYYSYSGGGVTISGGEVFCQKEFAESIIDACAEEGIPVAVETNLLHSFESIAPILKKLQMVMLDIKLMDAAQHKAYTGVDNSLILENVRKLDELGVPMVVRTPLIPGVTDTDDNLLAIAQFLSRLQNAKYYELLNFNPLGAGKYSALDKENMFGSARPLSETKISHIRQLLSDFIIKIS